jgi:hypothetical protein
MNIPFSAIAHVSTTSAFWFDDNVLMSAVSGIGYLFFDVFFLVLARFRTVVSRGTVFSRHGQSSASSASTPWSPSSSSHRLSTPFLPWRVFLHGLVVLFLLLLVFFIILIVRVYDLLHLDFIPGRRHQSNLILNRRLYCYLSPPGTYDSSLTVSTSVSVLLASPCQTVSICNSNLDRLCHRFVSAARLCFSITIQGPTSQRPGPPAIEAEHGRSRPSNNPVRPKSKPKLDRILEIRKPKTPRTKPKSPPQTPQIQKVRHPRSRWTDKVSYVPSKTTNGNSHSYIKVIDTSSLDS